jgi:hypothetical protein
MIYGQNSVNSEFWETEISRFRIFQIISGTSFINMSPIIRIVLDFFKKHDPEEKG